MPRLSDVEIDRLFADDVPYGDLTTRGLGIGDIPGAMVFKAGDGLTAACTEEAARLIERAGGKVDYLAASGSVIDAGGVLLSATGSAASLLAAWKVAQTLVEYASGIATATSRIVKAAKGVNPSVNIACTRKNFPGTKAIAVKSVLAGGAVMHRLGLSETILLFPEHRSFIANRSVKEGVVRLKAANPERKIVVEINSIAEAVDAAEAGADVIQTEKFSPAQVTETVQRLAPFNSVIVAAAGGINAVNAPAYAASGAHVLVTSAPFSSPPLDVKVSISGN